MIHFTYDGKSFKRLSDKSLHDHLKAAEGIFETMRVHDGKVFLLNEHFKRFFMGAKKLKMNILSKAQLKRALKELAGFDRGLRIIRIIYLKNNDDSHQVIFSISRKNRYNNIQYKKGLKLGLTEFGSTKNLLAGDPSVKHLSLLKLAKFRRLARQRGFDDHLILKNGLISDTSVANVFWVKGGTFFTPSPESCLLAGVTRNFVIKLLLENGYSVQQGNFGLEEIFGADEVFITNSLMEIMPVAGIALKNEKLLKFEIGEKTKFLMDIFDLKHFYS